MGIFDGCLLACDIDGTLISGSVLPQRNIERIEYFVENGGAFSLSTGRTAAAVGMITEKVKCISPSVLTNGCVIYDFKKGVPILERCLPEKALYMVKKAVECGISVEMHSANHVFVIKRSAASDLHESYESMTGEFIDFNEAKRHKINKILYFIEREPQGRILEAISKEYTESSTFYSTCTFIGGVKQNYFEQLPKGVSKAEALLSLCDILKIKKGGLFAIGDYYNDVPMLKAADISAAPADSPEDVKAAATVTVSRAICGAVADFINYLEEYLKNGQTNQANP